MFGWIKESAVYEAGLIGSSSWDEESSSYKVQLPAEVLQEAARVMDKGYLFYVHGTIEAEGTESEFYLRANKMEANRILFAEGSSLTEGLLTISYFDLTHVETEVADLMNDVTDLQTAYNNLTKLNIQFSVTGQLNKNSGDVGNNTSYSTTPFIPLKGIIAGIGYLVRSYNGIAVACLYDSNKAFISSISIESSSLVDTTGIITDFSTASYIRFCSYTAQSYVPELYVSNLESLKILGKAVTTDNITFSVHDPRTNLIDITKLTENKYVNGAVDGGLKSANGFYATSYIPLEEKKYYYFNENYMYRGYVAFYDSNKNYISGVGQASSAAGLASPFLTPEGTVYGRFTINSQSRIANAWLCETNQMAEKPNPYAEMVDTTFTTEKPTDYKGNEISVFTKILCIGDSLTAGFFNTNGDGITLPNRAYPAKLQALTGIACTNKGHSGFTSAEWYTEFQNTDLSGHDACLIQLGINDALQQVSTEQTATAFQNIITKVKTDNPKIKIFVATIPPYNGYMTTTMRAMSNTIKTIVADLEDPDVYVVDLWTYGHGDDYLAYDSGHPSALGCLRLAEDWKAYVSYIIKTRIFDFRKVQFIGTANDYNVTLATRTITY